MSSGKKNAPDAAPALKTHVDRRGRQYRPVDPQDFFLDTRLKTRPVQDCFGAKMNLNNVGETAMMLVMPDHAVDRILSIVKSFLI